MLHHFDAPQVNFLTTLEVGMLVSISASWGLMIHYFFELSISKYEWQNWWMSILLLHCLHLLVSQLTVPYVVPQMLIFITLQFILPFFVLMYLIFYLPCVVSEQLLIATSSVWPVIISCIVDPEVDVRHSFPLSFASITSNFLNVEIYSQTHFNTINVQS